ncbi:MAG: hypothetical protein ACXVQJ_01325 [Actinomycetota bacterium]
MSETDPQEDTVVQEPEAAAELDAATEGTEGRRARGWISLYLAAFVLLLVSGLSVALAARSLLQSLAPLYISIALSVVAAILAVVAVLLPKRG